MLNETDLDNQTNTYFKHLTEDGIHWDLYLSKGNYGNPPLLFSEILYAKSNGQRLPVELNVHKSRRSLVLLVGDSFEPLLQSILAYLPDEIYLVYSEFYGSRTPGTIGHISGKKHVQKLEELISWMKASIPTYLPNYGSVQYACPEPKKIQVLDNEDDVLDKLRAELVKPMSSPNCEVMVDITGAKKTMVVGAFLFAAYADDVLIRYVDFDKYCAEKHRPFGYTCHFREVTNLFHKINFQEWEQVRSLYQRYDFHGALVAMPKDTGAPDAGYTQLRTFIKMCGQWDNGLFDAAMITRQGLRPEAQALAPAVIECLGRLQSKHLAGNQAFFSDPMTVAWFAKDALLRIKRLSSLDIEDQGEESLERRNVFTRAYNLHESLLTARLAFLVEKGEILLDGTLVNSLADKNKLWEKIESNRFPIAVKMDFLRLGEKIIGKEKYTCASKTPEFPLLHDDVLHEERNNITHGWLPVTLHKEAVELAQKNYKNFMDVWAPWAGITNEEKAEIEKNASFQCPEWKALLQACGVTFLPDPTVIKK